jgi:hypothetical protein
VDKALRDYGDSPPEYSEFQLCREMGWTFTELEEQPAWRIEQAFLFLNRESVYQKSQQS